MRGIYLRPDWECKRNLVQAWVIADLSLCEPRRSGVERFMVGDSGAVGLRAPRIANTGLGRQNFALDSQIPCTGYSNPIRGGERAVPRGREGPIVPHSRKA